MALRCRQRCTRSCQNSIRNPRQHNLLLGHLCQRCRRKNNNDSDSNLKNLVLRFEKKFAFAFRSLPSRPAARLTWKPINSIQFDEPEVSCGPNKPGRFLGAPPIASHAPPLPAFSIALGRIKLESSHFPPTTSEPWTGEYHPTMTMSIRLCICQRQTCQTLP